jgi:hypothetical protein
MMKSTKSRLMTCFVLASLDFMSLLFPPLTGWKMFILVIAGLMLNLVVVFLVLKSVAPLMNGREHEINVTLSRRWVSAVGMAGTLAILAAGFQGSIERQSIPFLLSGYMLLLIVPGKILSLAVARGMDEADGK